MPPPEVPAMFHGVRSSSSARSSLLLVVFLALVVDGRFVSSARAQGASTPTDKVAMATTRGPAGEPWVFVYDVASERLAAYKTGTAGTELKGVRRLTWDLRLQDLAPRQRRGRLTVAAVQKAVEQQSSSADEPPAARGGPVILVATQGTSGEPWVYLYDLSSQRLASYKVGNTGFDLRSVRRITWDLQLQELNPNLGRSPRVRQVKAEVTRSAGAKDSGSAKATTPPKSPEPPEPPEPPKAPKAPKAPK